jgi:hypothetical protein
MFNYNFRYIVKKIIFYIALIIVAQTSTLSAAASEKPLSQATSPTDKPRFLVSFDSRTNHLEESRRIVLSISDNHRVDEQTKCVFKTIADCMMWVADQNNATKIKRNTIYPIPNAFNEPKINAKALTHFSYGCRQAQEARVALGFPVPPSLLKIQNATETVMKEAFKILSGEKPDFTNSTFIAAYKLVQAHAAVRSQIKKRPRIESPTKKEKRETQLITSLFTPVPFNPSPEPEDQVSTSSNSSSSSSLTDTTPEQTSSSSREAIFGNQTEEKRKTPFITSFFEPVPFFLSPERENQADTSSNSSSSSSLTDIAPEQTSSSSLKATINKQTAAQHLKKSTPPTSTKKGRAKRAAPTNNYSIKDFFKPAPLFDQEKRASSIEISSDSDSDTSSSSSTDEPVIKRQRNLKK